MSSWFKSSEEEDDQNQNPSTPPSVRDDLSVLGQTIGRQLRGVADFLAPPPLSTSTASTAVVAPVDDTSSEKFLGVKKDLVEIGGSFKTSLSLLSSNKAVTKISRFATNLLQLRHGNDDEEDDDDAVGITEDVVEFVVKISKRPELWTDFPLALGDDIDISDVQMEHAAVIEDLVPSLAALKHKVCNYLTEEQFWMIYFILLLPRLSEDESERLSTPEIVEARETLLQRLQNKNNVPAEVSRASKKLPMKTNEPAETYEVSEKQLQKRNDTPGETSQAFEAVKISEEGGKDNTEANKSPSHENDFPSEVVNVAKGSLINYHLKTKWFKERDSDTGSSNDAEKQSEDDISFSDVEDEDDDLKGKRLGLRRKEIKRVPSYSESSEWEQLNENPGTLGGVGHHKAVQSTCGGKDSGSGESYDWLSIDDADVDRTPSA